MMGSYQWMPFVIVAWFLAGGAAEVFNSAIRHWSVGRLGLQKRGRTVFRLVVGFVLRLALAASVLVLAFRHDVASGLAALIGYWICRWVVIWWLQRRVSKPGSHISR